MSPVRRHCLSISALLCTITSHEHANLLRFTRHFSISYTVGYKTYTLSDDYTLIGLCFENVAGGAMGLNDALPYKDGMTKGATSSAADSIQVMGTDDEYQVYFLSDGHYGKNNASYNAELDGKWLKTAGAACTDTVQAGQALWYVSKTAKSTPHSITVAGSVLATSATSPKACANAYTLIGNPYACDVPLNGGVVTTGAKKAATSSDSDNIQVMGEDNQYKVYFLSDGHYGKNNASYNAELDGKWLMTAGAACSDSIPAGRAIWYVSRNSGTTVQLTNPVAE